MIDPPAIEILKKTQEGLEVLEAKPAPAPQLKESAQSESRSGFKDSSLGQFERLAASHSIKSAAERLVSTKTLPKRGSSFPAPSHRRSANN